LPGSGKTTVAHELVRAKRAAFVRIDAIEQTITDWSSLEKPLGPVGYGVGYALAGEQLRLGLDVVVECVNPLAITRDAWVRTGTDARARVAEVEVICSDKQEHRRRVETRSVDIPGLLLPTWQQVLEREYEPWNRPHLVLDTAVLAAADCVAAIWDAS